MRIAIIGAGRVGKSQETAFCAKGLQAIFGLSTNHNHSTPQTTPWTDQPPGDAV